MDDYDKQRIRAKLKSHGAPEIHLRHVYDVEPQECEAIAAVRQWLAADTISFLLLLGGLGTLKSGAATWAMRSYVDDALFLGADELPRINSFDGGERIGALRHCPLLVLDDLGTEYQDAKGWAQAAFNTLINARYESARKTIITANLTPDDLKARYSARAVDRIRESGKVLVISGASQRRAQ